jgi:hypothetical protein
MFTLHIDRARFDANVKAVLDDIPGLVPVAKGNGYGLGIERLAREAAAMGADSIAVGSFAEARTVLNVHEFRRVLVMTPHMPGEPIGNLPLGTAGLVVHTITTAEAAADLEGRRVVVEYRTPLNRHGITAEDLPGLAEILSPVLCEGFALHLPMNRPSGYDPVKEITALVEQLDSLGLPTTTMYVSHLKGDELRLLGKRFPRSKFRARVGTRLWLGDRGALTAQATVLDVIPVERGERFGYRQRKAARSGHLLVVSGGTAHGVGLAAPKSATGPVTRAKILAEAGLAATNHALSPFSLGKRRLWFAETPHMQVSLLMLPKKVTPPAVGDLLTVDVRMTTTYFDAITEG